MAKEIVLDGNLYQMVQGVNQAVFYFLPLLNKHPEDYPRFRDCFMTEHCFQIKNELPYMMPKEKIDLEKDLGLDKIYVLTRVGGGNRDEYKEEIEKLRKNEFYIKDYDDGFDCTYATFVFNIPSQFKKDVNNLVNGKIGFREVSQKYKNRVVSILCRGKDKEFDQKIKNCFGVN